MASPRSRDGLLGQSRTVPNSAIRTDFNYHETLDLQREYVRVQTGPTRCRHARRSEPRPRDMQIYRRSTAAMWGSRPFAVGWCFGAFFTCWGFVLFLRAVLNNGRGASGAEEVRGVPRLFSHGLLSQVQEEEDGGGHPGEFRLDDRTVTAHLLSRRCRYCC